MRITYDKETDTLAVHLSEHPVADSDEPRPGVILDYDQQGHLVSFELLDASRQMTIPATVELEVIPRRTA
jgi:uncharacterized protein YuzE